TSLRYFVCFLKGHSTGNERYNTWIGMSFAGVGTRGHGDFTGLGNFNNFESLVDQTHITMDAGATPQLLSGNGRRQGISSFNLQQEIIWIKQDSAQIRDAVVLLEKEKDNLRQAVRKLKLENARVKQKMKRMQETINGLSGASAETDNIKVGAAEVDLDYDDIGRDFILVGGVHDPLSLRFEVAVRDERGVEHKSAERYYWYKMAEHFGDTETMAKILDAPTTIKAEEAMKDIKDFDEAKWDEVKMSVWEAGQRLKLEQTRWISNILVYTGKTYIAVASQDKVFGTGWSKNRDEANKPIFWDGENQGGKSLMRLRQQIKETHSWSGPYEEQEMEKRYNKLKKYVWRRIDPARRLGILRGRGRGFGRRGDYGERGYGAPTAFAQSVRH
uniref:NADAR domain-containing protein n=2 Tax=Parascaris univalens TaxID=6257 RepID=A0A914ZVU3_PARUN